MNIIDPGYPAPAFPMTPRDSANTTDLIYHHSDGPKSQSPLDIDAEHRREGWAMIGYDFIVDGDGKVYSGRPIDVVPSAAYGRNAQSIDVCLLGDFEPGTPGYDGAPTPAQLQAAKDLSIYLHQRYPSIIRTIGHRDVGGLLLRLGIISSNELGNYATACPGDTFEGMLDEIRSYTREKMPHK